MKYLVYILIIITNFNGCNAQTTTMEQEIVIPEITNKFEKLEKNNGLDNGVFIIEEQSYGFIRREFLNNSYFVLNKKYYSNYFIKEKAVSFINGYPIGYIYKFNEKGVLIETINTDEGYNFGWKDIIAYCEKYKIPLTKGHKEFDGFQTKIYKRELEGEKVWVITYLLPVGDKLMEITLDGKTGKEVKKRELDFIGG